MSQESSGKTRAISSAVWNTAEKMTEQVFYFTIGIILARLIAPEHYGVIAIADVFFSICRIFIAESFSEFFIQKKELLPEDISTGFFFIIGLSLFFYGLLFFLSPFIASFYEQPVLTDVLRILCLNLIFQGYRSIPKALMCRNLQFRLFFYSSLTGTILSGMIGIALALHDAGVWALVAFYLTDSLVDAIIITIMIRFRPGLSLSRKSLKAIFGYAAFSVSSKALSTYGDRLLQAIMGKMTSLTALSFYKRGHQYPYIIYNNTANSFNEAAFPFFSKLQEDKEALKQALRRQIKSSVVLTFPLLCGMLLIAHDIILLMIGEKWLPCVPYLQVICLAYLFITVSASFQKILHSLGKVSAEFLNQTILFFFQLLLGVLAFLLFPPISIAFVYLLTSVLSVLLNGIKSGRLLEYRPFEFFQDIYKTILATAVMSAAVFLLYPVALPLGLKLLLQILTGGLVYPVANLLLRNEAFVYLADSLGKMLRKKSR